MTTEAEHSGPHLDANDQPAIPQHVAIIMDGNGRWAEREGLPRLVGHRAGTENVRRTLQAVDRIGIRYLTIFAFSTENWGRPDDEVRGLMELLHSVIIEEARALHAHNVRIRHLGVTERLPGELSKSIGQAVKLTEGNTGLNLCVAFDYGGRAEIVDAVRVLIASGTAPEDITEAAISASLYLPDVPEPDLIIRTAGEQRTSNFLIWQAAYAEFYSTEVCWPDFNDDEVAKAVAEYGRRKRSFGRLPSGPGSEPGSEKVDA
jgi:undecaprenyl diphosphate synthase